MAERRIISIQYLRAIAALLVVFHHSVDQLRSLGGYTVSGFGASGVDLFFVISGFVMVYITDVRASTGLAFFVQRVLRIAPIYWFFTTLTALLLVAAPKMFNSNEFAIPHFILSMLFIAHESPTGDSVSPMLKLGWTLNYEMFFYAIFAFATGINVKLRVVITSCLLVLIVFIGYLISPENPVLKFYSSPIMLEFVYGMIIGAVLVKGKLVMRVEVAGVAAIIGVAIIALSPDSEGAINRFMIWGVAASLVVVGCLGLEQQIRIPVVRLPLLAGDASYSIYLAHLMPIVVFRTFVRELGIHIDGFVAPVIFVAGCLAVGLLAGLCSYLLIEKPLMSLAHRIRSTLRYQTL
jgi:peptidoglycan/LPS O-acetylase OafA/YrhL